jgi:hypothetical protein
VKIAVEVVSAPDFTWRRDAPASDLAGSSDVLS